MLANRIRHNRCNRGAAFTLIEILAGLAASAVLLAGLGATLYVARKASDPAQSVVLAGKRVGLLSDLAGELKFATGFAEHTSKVIEFNVADITGDGVVDVVRYEWSGVGGAPLVRTLNDGPAVNVVDKVQRFQVEYELQSVTEQVAANTEGPEDVLLEHTPGLLAGGFLVTNSARAGEHFMPQFPPDTVSWRVTGVKLTMAEAGPVTTGQVVAQLRRPTVNDLGNGSLMTEVTILEKDLKSYYKQEKIDFPACPAIPVNSGVCLVLKHVSDAASCKVEYSAVLVNTPYSNMLESNNGAATWTVRTDKSLWYRLFGRVVRSQSYPRTRRYLRRVIVALETSDSTMPLVTSACVLNRPELLGL